MIAEFAALAAAYAAFPTMKTHIFSGSRGKEAFASVFDLSALAEWGRSIGTVVQLLAAQFGGLWLWAVVVAAAAVVLWRRGCRLRGKGLFAAGLLLASAGYVVLIDKAAPFEADRYYVVIYAAVVLAVAVVLARLARSTRPCCCWHWCRSLRRTGPTPTPTCMRTPPRARLRWPTPRGCPPLC